MLASEVASTWLPSTAVIDSEPLLYGTTSSLAPWFFSSRPSTKWGVLPVPAVWVATSLIFAGYHMDPVQSVALVFTALGLGWLRWMSGSVWPGVLLHAVNNGLGVISAIALGGNADQHVSTAVAWSTAAASVLLLGVVARVRVGRGGVLASDAPLA